MSISYAKQGIGGMQNLCMPVPAGAAHGFMRKSLFSNGGLIRRPVASAEYRMARGKEMLTAQRLATDFFEKMA